MTWLKTHSGVEQLRVSDTYTVRAYYTSQGGRRVHLHHGVELGCICELRMGGRH